MLKLRILTALILLPLVLMAIFYLPQLPFAGICTLVILLAAWEWSKLMGWQNIFLRLSYVLIVLLMLGFVLTFALMLPSIYMITLGATVWLVITAYLFYIRRKPQLPRFPNWLVFTMGLIVLVSCWESLIVLHRKPAILLYMLLIVWLTDTVAYFAGRAWGKHKLAPVISPGKTAEGTRTAFIVLALFALVAQWLLGRPEQEPLAWIFATLPAIAAAVAGDLFESLLKRLQDLKDSGQLLPGHGGLLDRIDSLLAVAPVFACGAVMQGLLR